MCGPTDTSSVYYLVWKSIQIKKLIKILTNLYETHFQVKDVAIYIGNKNLPMAFIFGNFRQICLECTAVAYINQIPFRQYIPTTIHYMITCIFPTYLGRYSYGNVGTHLWVWLIFWLLHISFLQRATFFFCRIIEQYKIWNFCAFHFPTA